MSISTLILGNSGTGKTAAIRNLDPANTLLIQAVRKPLPFRNPAWGYFDKEKNPRGNIFVTDAWNEIAGIARKTQRKVIVVDDFQYVMSNEFMRRSPETGFQKFTEIARHAWEVLNTLNHLPNDVRVYILAHSQEDDMGNVKMKTIGKMLDEKITPEGLFSIVLRTAVDLGNYQFSTRNNGRDTVKTPMGLFEAAHIDNDLAAVDTAICDYYGITQTALESEGVTVTAQPAPQPAALPQYPDDRFTANFPQWRESIQAGKRTAAQIIDIVSSSYALTEGQRQAIHDCEAIEAEYTEAEGAAQ